MVPAMYFILHVHFKTAAAKSLVVMIPMAMTATALNFAKHGAKMELWPVLLMAATAVGGAYLGGELAKKLDVMTLRRIFAVMMVIAAVYMAFFRPESAKPKTGDGSAAAATAAPAGEAKQP